MDCELLTKVYINLIDQKEPLLDFKIDNVNIVNPNSKSKNIYSKKIIKITEEEIKLHKSFLKSSLKKNFFN